MKILGLISSLTDPASRARIIQYENYFTDKGHTLKHRYFTPLKDSNPQKWNFQIKKFTGINEWRTLDILKNTGRLPLLYLQFGYDIIWQNRLIHPHHFFWEKKLLKPVVFDFDDAIWLKEGEKQVIQKIQLADMVFAGNEFLADYANKYNQNIQIIPTTIDTNKLFPLNKTPDIFTIGWIGSETNFQYLKSIYQPIQDFLKKNNDSRLIIVSSHLPDFINLIENKIIFKKWDADTENEDINGFSVGLMPLTDTEWTRGKCSYKLLQYLACGIPSIASPVGSNKKIITDNKAALAATTSTEWLAALYAIKNEPPDTNGQKYIEENYSCKKWGTTIIEQMKTIL